ncbi:MAG: NUDIX domain-containing protein [Proteobacteria bacterium]|nr:NUDIX domain-containing protein [Pseudomonadota bacterium]
MSHNRAEVDPIRLSKTMAFLLRHRPERGNLRPDRDGWVSLIELVDAVSRLVHREIAPDVIANIASEDRGFEMRGSKVRAHRSRGRRLPLHPDILFHATTQERVDEILAAGVLEGGTRPLVFSGDESGAWRTAHRFRGEPRLLVIDASRARRDNVYFTKSRRSGLFLADHMPLAHMLNLQPNYAEQLSAGGIPIRLRPDGRPELCLIRVKRRNRTTWEVAKGKLEPGETPEQAGCREICEEMGIDVPFTVIATLGEVRYGFLAPGGLPRLKRVYLYLVRPEGPMDAFNPSTREGIGDVRWFSPDEACRVVRHTSLIPLMQRTRELLRQRALPALFKPKEG